MRWLHTNSIYGGSITLVGEKNDYGEYVSITEPVEWLITTDRYNYWRTPQGVFKRSVNYWAGSPYGYQRMLPCHLNAWGMQTIN